MATFNQKCDNILHLFCNCTKQQQNEILVKLLLKCEPLQLRILYSELKPLLAVDFVAYIPRELVDKILNFLNVDDLCSIAMCNKMWRNRANNDALWKRMCKRNNWIKYGDDNYSTLTLSTAVTPTSNQTTVTSPSYPHINLTSSEVNIKPCKWKEIYMRAYHLDQNWSKGRYTVMPSLRGHKQRVTCLSCDGKVIASGSEDNTVRIWDLYTGTCKYILENHTDSVRCSALKDDILVTGCADSILRMFDMKTGRYLRSLIGHEGGIESLSFNGDLIISASIDTTIRVWKSATGRCLYVMRGHTEEIMAMDLNERYAITSAWDDTIRLWNVQSGKCENICMNGAVAYCLQLDKQKLFSGNDDGSINIWNIKGKTPIARLIGHTQEVYCLVHSENIVASGSADSTVRIWNHYGKCLHVLNKHIGVVRCLQLNGTRLISGGDRKMIILWNVQTGELVNVLHRNPTLLHKMWCNDTRIVTASPDSPGTLTVISFW